MDIQNKHPHSALMCAMSGCPGPVPASLQPTVTVPTQRRSAESDNSDNRNMSAFMAAVRNS